MGLADLFRPKWKHSSYRVRLEAVKKIDDQSLLETIALQDEDVSVRLEAVKKIDAQPVLEKIALQDEEPSVRLEAVKKIDAQTPVLEKIALQDEEPSVRREAVKKIDAQPVLERIALQGKHRTARLEAAKKIDAQPVLERIALQDVEYSVRLEAVKKIDAQPVLERIALQDKDASVRQEAAKTIDAQPVLERIALQDEDASARLEAVKKIDAQPVLGRCALQDESYSVRREAAKRVRDPEILEKIVLSSTSAEARNVINAIGCSGDRRALEALVRIAVGKGSSRRLSLNWEQRRTQVYESLLTPLRSFHWRRDSDGRRQSAAAHALGILGDPRAVAPLLNVLSGDQKFHEAAHAAKKLFDAGVLCEVFRALAGEWHVVFSEASAGSQSEDTRLGDSLEAQKSDVVLHILLEPGVSPSDRFLDWAEDYLAGLCDPEAVADMNVESRSGMDGDIQCRIAALVSHPSFRFAETAAAKMLDSGAKIGFTDSRLRSFSTKDEDTRKASVEMLGRMRDFDSVDKLTLALIDASPEVRRAAAEALNALGQPLWMEYVKGEPEDLAKLAASGQDTASVREHLIREIITSKYCDAPEFGRNALSVAGALRDLGEPRWGSMLARVGGLSLEEVAKLRDKRASEPIISVAQLAKNNARRLRAHNSIPENTEFRKMIALLQEATKALSYVEEPDAVSVLEEIVSMEEDISSTFEKIPLEEAIKLAERVLQTRPKSSKSGRK